MTAFDVIIFIGRKFKLDCAVNCRVGLTGVYFFRSFHHFLICFCLVYNEESAITISIVRGAGGSGNLNPGMAATVTEPTNVS